MADAYIFTGPTLNLQAIEEKFGMIARGRTFTLGNGKIVELLPPAAEGDVFELVASKPALISIIDGYFENVPSVWHKEILYAMTNGIHVLGAASMGALRAAELATFGMEGIGKVYQAYASQQLNDDDEVAVAHGPEELGFPQVSDAMVNIRETLQAAENAEVISSSENALLTRIAKAMFYKERTYNNVMKVALRLGMSQHRITTIENWLETNKVDQKQADAFELVAIIFERLVRQEDKKQVLYNFDETVVWKSARTKPHEDPDAA